MKTFGKLENELIDLCHQCPPNFEAIKAKIAEGADVNANDGDNASKSSLLSEVICNFGWIHSEGSLVEYGNEYLPDIVKILLDAGFDVALDEGRYGAKALSNLIFCASDKHILEAAKLLLEAGADPSVAPYEDEPYETVIGNIRFDAAVCDNTEDERV